MRRRVFGDGGAGADGGTLRYCYRRDQLSIGANKNIILDDRLVFIGAIVIARNRAGTDVDVLSDYGIADVAQVIRLAAGGDGAIFDFNEITDMDVVSKPGSGTDACVRSDTAVLSDFSRFDQAEWCNGRTGRNLDVFQDTVSAHFHAIIQMYVALENAVDIYFHIPAADELAANIDTGGIRQRHTLFQ